MARKTVTLITFTLGPKSFIDGLQILIIMLQKFTWIRRFLCRGPPDIIEDNNPNDLITFSEATAPIPSKAVKERNRVHFGASNNVIQISRNNSMLYSNQRHRKETKPIHFNTRNCHEAFYGKEDILEDFHHLVEESKRSGDLITVLCPAFDSNRLGGIGTTETMRRYVQKHAKKYKHIIWIDAENNITIKNCFMRLAENKLKMYLLDENGKYLLFSTILKGIYEQLCTEPCLIVFDNTKSLESQEQPNSDIQNFLPLNLPPKGISPVVLIASRNTNWSQGLFFLEPLSKEECVDILLGQLRVEPSEQNQMNALNLAEICGRLPVEPSEQNQMNALNLAEICGRLPLGLQLIIAVIKSIDSYTMHDFLETYEEGVQKYMKHRPVNSSTDASIFIITNIIFEHLIKHNSGQLALKFMEAMAYLSPVIIPKDLLFSMFPRSTEGALTKALNLLNKYSLIIDFKSYFQIHRMIQQATIETLRANDLEVNALRQAVCSVQNFLLSKEPNSHCFREGLACAVHLENALKTYAVPEYLNFAKFVASKLEDIHFEESYDLFMKILEFEKEILPPYHELILETQNHIATVLRNLNKFEDSLELYFEILQNASTHLGLDHALTLCVQHNIATILAKQDLNSDALEIFADVLEKRKTLFGTDNCDTLDTQSNMAAVLNKQGERGKALELYSEASEGRARLLGHDHPDTLRTQNELAAILFVQGKTEEAAALHADVLETATRSFGINHPLTLLTQGHLA
ncbi:unnamed protein product, partial [Allacma fusca]